MVGTAGRAGSLGTQSMVAMPGAMADFAGGNGGAAAGTVDGAAPTGTQARQEAGRIPGPAGDAGPPRPSPAGPIHRARLRDPRPGKGPRPGRGPRPGKGRRPGRDRRRGALRGRATPRERTLSRGGTASQDGARAGAAPPPCPSPGATPLHRSAPGTRVPFRAALPTPRRPVPAILHALTAVPGSPAGPFPQPWDPWQCLPPWRTWGPFPDLGSLAWPAVPALPRDPWRAWVPFRAWTLPGAAPSPAPSGGAARSRRQSRPSRRGIAMALRAEAPAPACGTNHPGQYPFLTVAPWAWAVPRPPPFPAVPPVTELSVVPGTAAPPVPADCLAQEPGRAPPRTAPPPAAARVTRLRTAPRTALGETGRC